MDERKLIIGLIVSTDYCKRIRPHWDSMLLESSTARLLADITLKYYDKYKEAPGRDIENIVYKKIHAGNIDSEIAEDIEEDIMPGLSKEYEKDGINVQSLCDDTIEYINERKLLVLNDNITNIIEHGKGDKNKRIEEAEKLIEGHKGVKKEFEDDSIDLSKKHAKKAIKKAFAASAAPLIHFPKQLGTFWGDSFIPGGFVSLLAPEKRGKTFFLLDIAMRAARNGKKVAFFQAGDMNEGQQLKRAGVYLTKRSTMEKYCKPHYACVRDCKLNQLDECTKEERECDFGPFDDRDVEYLKTITFDELVESYQMNQDYRPCWNCSQYDREKLGAPWITYHEEVPPIDEKDTWQAVHKYFQKGTKRPFKLSTHANGTLSVSKIENILDNWEVEEAFVPDVILIDYSDLLIDHRFTQERDKQNQVWKDLRKLSQTERKGVQPLVISPTQADARAYSIDTLTLENFSEDKRKYAHCTAMYGLNQDKKGREKKAGLLRINEIILRDGEFDSTNTITVTQNLKQGKPIIHSYFS